MSKKRIPELKDNTTPLDRLIEYLQVLRRLEKENNVDCRIEFKEVATGIRELPTPTMHKVVGDAGGRSIDIQIVFPSYKGISQLLKEAGY